MAAVPKIVEELIKTVNRSDCSGRLRLAVTAEEYEEIRQYAFLKEGRFLSRIRNVPIIVDEAPFRPPLWIEYADDSK
jgi:hypothetical protein